MFADNLKALRKKSGLSKAEVARRLNIPYTTYNAYETEGKEPRYERLKNIADILGTTPTKILGWQCDITNNEYQHVLHYKLEPLFKNMMSEFEKTDNKVIDGINLSSQEYTELFFLNILENINFEDYVNKFIKPIINNSGVINIKFIREKLNTEKNVIIHEIGNNLVTTLFSKMIFDEGTYMHEVANSKQISENIWTNIPLIKDTSLLIYETLINVFFKSYAKKLVEDYFSLLNESGQEKALEYIIDLSEQSKYTDKENIEK